MIEFMVSLTLFVAFIALLYGFIATFASCREAGQLRADFDLLLGYKLHSNVEHFSAVPVKRSTRLPRFYRGSRQYDTHRA